jgi:hypothetical protein
MSAQQRQIDTNKSAIVIHVGKSGVFSGFAHNHEIAASIARGNVNTSAPLSVALRVRDSDVSEVERNDIQTTMLGPEVLDSERYPEIYSNQVQSKSWEPVIGLCGVNWPCTVRLVQ